MQTHVADYEFDPEKQLTLPEFYRKFKDKLPLLVIVTEGFYGETKYDDYANDQVCNNTTLYEFFVSKNLYFNSFI